MKPIIDWLHAILFFCFLLFEAYVYINEIKYDELPGEDASFVENLVKDIQENWSLFIDNIEKLKTRTINRCNFVKEVEHIEDSI